MKNILYKKKWNTGTLQVHVEPPPTPLIKINNYEKSEKDCDKIKLCRILISGVGGGSTN